MNDTNEALHNEKSAETDRYILRLLSHSFTLDFVVCCESEVDAKGFLESLMQRLMKFGLEVSADKTKIVKFGKREWQLATKQGRKCTSFNFLGFTHYGKKSRYGKLIVGHKTTKENLSRKLKEIEDWMKAVRNVVSLKEWWPILRAKLVGHFNYFGISGNYRCIKQFYSQVISKVFKWINRRSQKKSMNVEKFNRYMQFNSLPRPRICYSLYT
jgi:RNA-directed DNA polymerase